MTRPLSIHEAPAAPSSDAAGSNLTPSNSDPCGGLEPFSKTALSVFFKIPAHTCCSGVDVPGVGHIHALDCAAMARRAQLPETLGDFVSERASGSAARNIRQEVLDLIDDIYEGRAPLRRRRKLVAELVFVAKKLAERNLFSASGIGLGYPSDRICRECQGCERASSSKHRGECLTGRVLRIIELLLQLPKRKEAVAEGEGLGSSEQPKPVAEDLSAGAEEGVPPLQPYILDCAKCGARDVFPHTYEGFISWVWRSVSVNISDALHPKSNHHHLYISGTDVVIFAHDCERAVRP